jgi:6-phosphogluconolactonase
MNVVYVSSADCGEITVLHLDQTRGTLMPVQSIVVGNQAMPLALSPDRRFLYAALRSQPYTVVSLRIAAGDGRLEEIGRSALPDSMAYLTVDGSGRWLFGASYGGDRISVSPIAAGGAAGVAAQVMATGRHAHAVLVAPSNRHVLVTNLGADQVMQLNFDPGSGRLSPHTPSFFAGRAGAGPRHFVLHPNGRWVYLLNELDASVDVLAFDSATGTLSARLQTVSTLAPGFDGKPWAADLRLTPAGDLLVASERTSSTLTTFHVDALSGRLTLLARSATETRPRSFAIDSTGSWLVAVGQLSHAAGLYRLDAASGVLAARDRCAVGRNPGWVEIVPLPLAP